jgi:hypothetical protein
MLGQLLAFVNGDLTGPESLELFAELVNTGYAWQLEGHYGREAARLIDSGMLELGQDGRYHPNPEYMEDLEELYTETDWNRPLAEHEAEYNARMED